MACSHSKLMRLCISQLGSSYTMVSSSTSFVHDIL